MQNKPFNAESMAFLIESSKLPAEALGGYRIFRSPWQTKYVNVVVVDTNDQIIAVKVADLTLDEAQLLVEMLNKEFEETNS